MGSDERRVVAPADGIGRPLASGSEAWAFEAVVLPHGPHPEPWWVDAGVLRYGRPPTSRAVDRLPGRFVLAGLVDAHTHVALEFAGGGAVVSDDRYAPLHAHLEAGILAVRDVGAPPGAEVPRGRGRAGLPDVIGGSHYIAPPDRYFPALNLGVAPGDAPGAAAAQVARGVEWVKVVADDPTTEASFFDPPPTWAPAELDAIVDAVHRAGGRVAVHVTGRAVDDVVRSGADSIEHGSLLDPNLLAAMVERGVAWTPTVATVVGGVQFVGATGSRALAEVAHRHLDQLRASLPIAERLGVQVLAGTDMLGHGNLADEVAALIALGMSPTGALAAATDTPRDVLGLPRFADGHPAEIVTYDRDPREDPEVLRHPVAVVHAGRRIR